MIRGWQLCIKVCMVRLCIRYFRIILAVVSCVLNESSKTSGTSVDMHVVVAARIIEAQLRAQKRSGGFNVMQLDSLIYTQDGILVTPPLRTSPTWLSGVQLATNVQRNEGPCGFHRRRQGKLRPILRGCAAYTPLYSSPLR